MEEAEERGVRRDLVRERADLNDISVLSVFISFSKLVRKGRKGGNRGMDLSGVPSSKIELEWEF